MALPVIHPLNYKCVRVRRDGIRITTAYWSLSGGREREGWCGFNAFRAVGNGYYKYSCIRLWREVETPDGFGVVPKTMADVIRYMDYYLTTQLEVDSASEAFYRLRHEALHSRGLPSDVVPQLVEYKLKRANYRADQ